jgi:hypothetical protein
MKFDDRLNPTGLAGFALWKLKKMARKELLPHAIILLRRD